MPQASVIASIPQTYIMPNINIAMTWHTGRYRPQGVHVQNNNIHTYTYTIIRYIDGWPALTRGDTHQG